LSSFNQIPTLNGGNTLRGRGESLSLMDNGRTDVRPQNTMPPLHRLLRTGQTYRFIFSPNLTNTDNYHGSMILVVVPDPRLM